MHRLGSPFLLFGFLASLAVAAVVVAALVNLSQHMGGPADVGDVNDAFDRGYEQAIANWKTERDRILREGVDRGHMTREGDVHFWVDGSVVGSSEP